MKMHLFFSTPIWTSEIDDYQSINKELLKYIYDEKNSDPTGKRKSNVDGWHSKEFEMSNLKLKNFLEAINSKIKDAILDMGWDINNQVVRITSMWSIINKKNSFNERHHHGNSDLSAAYYVNADTESGDIVFYDPRQSFTFSHPENSKINNLNAQIKSINPKSGMLVLFPSYLDHSVNPSKSEKDRVVISFNVSLIPKRYLK